MGTESEQLIEQHTEQLKGHLEENNALKVRELCRKQPDLMVSGDMRLNIWSCLLLGRKYDSSAPIIEDDFVPNVPCREFQVLLNDVPRTRSSMPRFCTDDTRASIQFLLHKFCTKQNIEYKQGLNEVVAPFIHILPPQGGKSNPLAYDLFEAFVIRFIERFYCTDSSFFLMKSFRLFNLLLQFHDPQLALYLHEQDFAPELYTPQMFLCVYCREVSMEYALLIWDLFIVFDDPAFTFFIAVVLITQQRNGILLSDMNGIPEVISSNENFKSPEGIRTIVTEAQAIYRKTPRSFVRHLRLCCVGSNSLTPSFKDITQRRQMSGEDGESRIALSTLDQRMVLQTARGVPIMTAHELLSIIDPVTTSEADTPEQVVLIDLRGAEEAVSNGAGLIPRAIQLEPNFLDFPDAFRAWLQHFDATRGVHICIIDMPPVQQSGIQLWRRLLLGEGDGIETIDGYSKAGANNGSSSSSSSSPGRRGSSRIGSPRGGPMTLEQQEKAIVQAVTKADSVRSALRLATILQRESFPYVSVLEGGFPALVTQLHKQRGRVEPILIQHDPVQWTSFMEATGRDMGGGEDLEGDMTAAKNSARRTLGSKLNPAISPSSNIDNKNGNNLTDRRVKRASELSWEERLELATKRAARMGHAHMGRELESRRAVLATQKAKLNAERALEARDVIDFR